MFELRTWKGEVQASMEKEVVEIWESFKLRNGFNGVYGGEEEEVDIWCRGQLEVPTGQSTKGNKLNSWSEQSLCQTKGDMVVEQQCWRGHKWEEKGLERVKKKGM